MNRCAVEVMKDIKDITMAYGQSDEYRYSNIYIHTHLLLLGYLTLCIVVSFVLPKSSNLYARRASKISSTIVSMFAANYVMRWSEYFGNVTLQYPPCFDSRVVCYPSDQNLRDYLSWRQADCKCKKRLPHQRMMMTHRVILLGHINNLYNTTFWAIVHSGKTETQAEEDLRVRLDEDNTTIFGH